MTKYNLEVPDDLWKAFKMVITSQGLKVKDAMPLALQEYVENHRVSQVKIDFKVIADAKKNLLTFIYEEELKLLIGEVVKAKQRKAPPRFMADLKNRIMEIVKKHPTMTKELAEEVVTVFKTLQ
ncbi:hypothetical protein KAU55_04550 [Candidatus Bathyarchaeota archaeon]|nr:hypothetical protein [Candidatus Bathyarchaeota archaeon]